MQYSTCKCGKYQSWNSGVYTPCLGCRECGTRPGGEPIEPHNFVAQEVETDDGPAMLHRCEWCMRTRSQVQSEIEREKSA
jgi:hypothetical protein